MKERYLRVLKTLTVYTKERDPLTRLNSLLFFLSISVAGAAGTTFVSNLMYVLPNVWLRWLLVKIQLGLLLFSLILWGMFRVFPKTVKLKVLFSYIEVYTFLQLTLFWASFWENYISVFSLFLVLNAIYIVVSLLYQILIIDKIDKYIWQHQNNLLFMPMILLALLSVFIMIAVKIFDLSGYFVITAMELATMSITLGFVYLINNPYVEKD